MQFLRTYSPTPFYHTFRYIALEDKAIEMGDGTVNVFFNAGMYDKMESENMFLKIA